MSQYSAILIQSISSMVQLVLLSFLSIKLTSDAESNLQCPPGYVGGINFILTSGSELATVVVDITSNALKMTISAGLLFAAAAIGLIFF